MANVPLKDCQQMCTTDSSCIAFASNPSHICWITDINQTLSEEIDGKNVNAACYKKIKGKIYQM